MFRHACNRAAQLVGRCGAFQPLEASQRFFSLLLQLVNNLPGHGVTLGGCVKHVIAEKAGPIVGQNATRQIWGQIGVVLQSC
ncbi:hypothetical protein ACVIF9_001373 [Bradyrhizobium sp. USDA 4350]